MNLNSWEPHRIAVECTSNEVINPVFHANSFEIMFREIVLTDDTHARYRYYLNEYDYSGKLLQDHFLVWDTD
ncbi:MAG: hypothetical protein GC180_12120 [Bacteroidetes bacterium]|nr:hypothetical protein [Bacteroidota bacterium]